MVLFVLKFIFIAVSTISNLVSWIIFTTAAHLLVLMIQAFKVSGEATKGAMEQAADAIKSSIEYLVEFIWEGISSVFSTIFDLLKEGIPGSAAAAGGAIGGLMAQTRDSIEVSLKELTGVLVGFSEMISTIITDLWNNYKEAVGYVTKNA